MIQKSRISIRPQQNLSAERGQAEQDLCGLDEDGLDYDEEEGSSEKCGDSEPDEVEVADDVKSQEDIDEEEEPTIAEEAPVRMTRNRADPTAEEREARCYAFAFQGLVPCMCCCQSN